MPTVTPSVNLLIARSVDGADPMRIGVTARLVRLATAVVLALMAVLLVQVSPARAEGDSVDSWDFRIQVDAQGLVHVTEQLTFRFGQTSGRHGIVRSLVVREPWDDQQDAVYTISDVTVQSTDASDEFRVSTVGSGRNRTMDIRIGSQDRTITSPTATYTITYTVAGAMRSFADYDEFYWDLLSGEAPATRSVTAEVSVPGGARKVSCSNAPPGGQQACTSAAIAAQTAEFVERDRRAGEVMTIGVMVASGQVANPQPDLRPKAEGVSSTREQAPGASAAVVPLAVTALAGLVGFGLVRRKGRDLRFLGVPPGVVPPPQAHAAVGLSPEVEIPVAFSPPRIPVAEAGLLVDGQVDVRETTATLVDLTVRGAIAMTQREDGTLLLRLVDAGRVQAPHESVLVNTIFAGQPTGRWLALSGEGAMEDAHRAMARSVSNQVSSRGWFTDVPRTRARAGIGSLAGVAFFAFPLMGGSLMSLWPWVLAMAGVGLVVSVVRMKLRRGQRTAVGRAVTDQIEGFEIYLRTAETDQLRFEEGEDIFSRYLPWAIIFGVAERWARVCQPLIEQGRIAAPTWTGSTLFDYYLFTSMLNSLDTVSRPAPSSGSGMSGTGFGGGSSFGGGGISSGGGGGGGSASSW